MTTLFTGDCGIKMQIEIEARNISLCSTLSSHVTRRLGFALASKAEHILRVQVHLADINGPSGGPYKRCHIHLLLPELEDIVIEDIDVDLYAAIDRAADRSGRTLTRHLTRIRQNSRLCGPGKRTLLSA